MKHYLWALAALSVLVAHAYDLTTLDNKVYKDIRLLEKNDGGIRVAHTDGVASIDYNKLKQEEARLFGYDEAKYLSFVERRVATANLLEADKKKWKVPTQRVRPTPAPTPSPPARPSTTTNYTPPPAISGAARGQCTATTKKGYRCSRMAQAGSSTCWQH